MTVEQCLFGYDDGHRLLASSIPLGTEAATLTEMSDLAPGAVFGRSESYWTGVPAPGISRYVLMRTWPAPEMSRPGCVWTHALLFEPSLLEELGDLAALRPTPGAALRCLRPGTLPWILAGALLDWRWVRRADGRSLRLGRHAAWLALRDGRRDRDGERAGRS